MDNVERWPTLKGSRQRRLAETDLSLLRLAFRSLQGGDGAEEEAELGARDWLLACRKDGLHVLRAVVWRAGRETDHVPVRWRAVLVRELERMEAEEEYRRGGQPQLHNERGGARSVRAKLGQRRLLQHLTDAGTRRPAGGVGDNLPFG